MVEVDNGLKGGKQTRIRVLGDVTGKSNLHYCNCNNKKLKHYVSNNWYGKKRFKKLKNSQKQTNKKTNKRTLIALREFPNC